MSEHKTKEDCEAAGMKWNDESKTCTISSSDTDLIRENEMLKARLKTREDQLRQAIEIANKANTSQQARSEAERQDLIDHIVIDTNGKYTKDELKDKPLKEIQLIKTALDKSLEHTFTNIAAFQAEQDRKKKPHLTIGAWDNEKKQWTGGV